MFRTEREQNRANFISERIKLAVESGVEFSQKFGIIGYSPSELAKNRKGLPEFTQANPIAEPSISFEENIPGIEEE